MNTQALAVLDSGLVTSVGSTARSCCAAIRGRISNPVETRVLDASGEAIVAHQAELERPWRGIRRLTRMAAMVIEESLAQLPRDEWPHLPLLLCTAEPARPGRPGSLEAELLDAIQREVGCAFSPESALIPNGRVGAAVGLLKARKLIYQRGIPYVLVVGTDSLLTRTTLEAYFEAGRLLTPDNSNGFMPGEGASAILLGKPTGRRELLCVGLGFGTEEAHILSEAPLRADGLTRAHKAALAECGLSMDQVDYRIADLSGEQYYFKEASLAYSRMLRVRSDNPELWHPAEFVGEGGAAIGGICLAVARAAAAHGYAPGPTVVLHFGNDQGQRATVVAVIG